MMYRGTWLLPLFFLSALCFPGTRASAEPQAVSVTNGILRATFDGEVFTLAWEDSGGSGDQAALPFISDMTFQKTWTQKYDLVKTAAGAIRIHHDLADVTEIKAIPNAPDGPQIRITFALQQPEAKRVNYHQTLTLLRDQPIARFLATFDNPTDQDFYVGARWFPVLQGQLTGKMSGRKVARWGKGWEDNDSVRSGYGRIKWVRERCMSVESPTGHGVAFMILTPDNPLEHYHDFDRWYVGDPKGDPDHFRLSLLGDKWGGGSTNTSVQIPAHDSETTGLYIVPTLPERDTRTVMKTLFRQLQQGKTPAVPPAEPHDASTRDAEKATALIMSPVEDARLTDLAVEFRWKRSEGYYDYEIEIADNPRFNNAQQFTVGGESPYLKLIPDSLLNAGEWWWRLRGFPFRTNAPPGEWTQARKMTISDDHTPAPPIRTINAAQPLIILRDNFVTLKQLRDLIPQSLNDVMAIEYYSSIHITVTQPDTHLFCQEAQALDIHGFLPIDTPLAEVEWAFQNCPNVLGLAAGELFYHIPRDPKLREHCYRAMKLCRKYGRFMIWPDMHKYSFLWFADDPVFGDPANAPYFIPLHKTTNPSIALAIQSQVLGWWVGGLAENFGVQIDSWYWASAGYGKLDETDYLQREGKIEHLPPTFHIQQWLLGVMQGGAVIKNECDQPWTDQGENLEMWSRYYVPFFKALIEHEFVPPEDAARSAVRIAVRPEIPEQWRNGYLHNFEEATYGPFEALYQTIYGVNNSFKEWIPQTGRYHFTPILPADTLPIYKGTRVIPSSDLQDPAAIRDLYDASYPPISSGDAFVSRVGDSICVMTTEENADVTQDFNIPLEHALIKELAGEVGPHKYIMAKLEGDGFWLHANTSHPERATKLRLHCARKPSVQVVPASDRHVIEWDPDTSALTVQLDHTDGAAEITLGP